MPFVPSFLFSLQGWKLSNVQHMQLRMWHQLFCSTLDWPGKLLIYKQEELAAVCRLNNQVTQLVCVQW